MTDKKRVLIIGGGFGGLNVAKSLGRTDVEIVLLDRLNHHLFQPLLYQVATAALSPGNIASPLRGILRRQQNTSVAMQEVVGFDKNNRTVSTSDCVSYPYDYLIIATGASHSYFGHPEWEKFAPGLKTIEDALNIRERVLRAFEMAECCHDAYQQKAYMRFVIIGGGPTGVEMAGAIAEVARHSLFENFRRINPEQSEIILIEGENDLLPSFPPKLAADAKTGLEKIGVTVMTNTKVTHIDEMGVYIGETFIPTATVVWAAGNMASNLLKALEVPLDKQGRVLVTDELTIPEHPEIFVIGDAARALDKKGSPLPGIAPVAIQQGRYVADIIKRDLNGKDRKPFIYFDKGMMATIGRGKAVAAMGTIKISGFFAWLAWGLIHIYYVIGFKNRTFVLLHWFYLYLFGSRSVRLITRFIPEKFKSFMKKQ